jgi:hypothetical protein
MELSPIVAAGLGMDAHFHPHPARRTLAQN